MRDTSARVDGAIVRTMWGFDKHRVEIRCRVDSEVMRSGLAALLLIVLLPALVVANASTWATRTVLDDRAFTTTVGRAMDTPALEAALADAAAEVITEKIDELGPEVKVAAAAALGIGTDVSDVQVRSWVDTNILAALRSNEVEAARDDVVLELHAALIDSVDGRGAVRVEGDRLVVDVGDVYDAAVERLDPRAVQFAGIDAGDAAITVAQAQEIAAIRQGLSTLRVLQVIIPLAVVVAVLLILVLAHRRVRALGIVGVAIMLAGLASLGLAWASGGVVRGIPDDPTAGDIAENVYEQFISLLLVQSALLVLGGALLALVAWLLLRRRPRMRSARSGA
jgi:hypothetical protein